MQQVSVTLESEIVKTLKKTRDLMTPYDIEECMGKIPGHEKEDYDAFVNSVAACCAKLADEGTIRKVQSTHPNPNLHLYRHPIGVNLANIGILVSNAASYALDGLARGGL